MPRLILLALLLAVLVVPTLGAAPVPKTDDTPSASAIGLLEHRKVQKELKLTAEQRIGLVDGLADLKEAYETKFDELTRAPNPTAERYEKIEREHRKNVEKLLTAAVATSFTAAQRKRIQQLDWHVRGVPAFTDPKVAKVLQLTEAQKKKAAELAERQKGAVDRFFDNPNNEDTAKRKVDLLVSRRDFQKRMEELLTADQKADWKAVLGAPPTAFVIEQLWLQVEEDADVTETGK